MKAIVIARVSTEEQKEASLSLPAKLYALRTIVKAKILMLFKVLVLMKALINKILFKFLCFEFILKRNTGNKFPSK